ncbi:uracil-DNA glycosylase [Pseudomethylobacillus aquaticus]|uniref:Type-5 uracil-DNA glycosylase n=1 Tax=Pseudomethylobacillus aquaticus TaxID=2676064 RepID=A0A3N0V699_9PROT|nr:uracil-DNA glycosylase [Pseudomethylobacillus aquaticus]ROH88340.1 uracil-DNA glycosylase [Pseudomethylobacillus aquaticus]
MNPCFDSACRLCPRLSGFLDQVKLQHPDYYARPVPPFGVDEPALLIVGLAPGMHGANRSGRPFTGDYAGVLLYDTLHRFGYASAPVSVSADDGLQLIGCRISNAVKCLPPENKPTTQEINTCNRYLANEIAALPTSTVMLALGNVAHLAVLKALGLKPAAWKFGHAVRHALPDGRVLYDSYHCSRYNTQTRRLTEPMFHQVFAQIQLEARS